MELESQVGREWTCKNGIRRVLGVRTMKNGGVYLECSPSFPRYGETEIRHVFMGGGNDLIPTVEELERMIAIDERNAIDHAEWMKAEAARLEAGAAAKLVREDLDGFDEGATPMQRQRIIDALAKEIRNNGKYTTRKELVRDWVQNRGAQVETVGGKRALVDSEGWYLPERILTKTALDYAAYLVERKRELVAA